MKQLILMRHAQAQLVQYGQNDRNRSITIDGMHEIDGLRRKIYNKLSNVQMVICSNARRTRQTMDSIRNLLPTFLEAIYEDKFYQAPADLLIERIQQVPDTINSVMVIAHNPGLSDILQKIPNISKPVILSTGNLAFINMLSLRWAHFQPGQAQLSEIITP